MKRLLAAGLLCALGHAACAAQVLCHYSYGGVSEAVPVAPASQPYEVPVRAIGSYFLWRVVLEPADWQQAALKITTYVDRPSGPVPIHQASYPLTALRRTKSAWGFTGLQTVYEPVRDSELQYWCESK